MINQLIKDGVLFERIDGVKKYVCLARFQPESKWTK